jgi:hypothetical protein
MLTEEVHNDIHQLARRNRLRNARSPSHNGVDGVGVAANFVRAHSVGDTDDVASASYVIWTVATQVEKGVAGIEQPNSFLLLRRIRGANQQADDEGHGQEKPRGAPAGDELLHETTAGKHWKPAATDA